MFFSQNNIFVSIFLRKSLDEKFKCLLVQLVTTVGVKPGTRASSVPWPVPTAACEPNKSSSLSSLSLQKAHSLFQSEFSTECHLMLPHSVCSTLSFPSAHPVGAYVFFLVLSSLLSNLQYRVLKASSYAISDRSVLPSLVTFYVKCSFLA